MAAERTKRNEPALVLHSDESVISVVRQVDDRIVEQVFRDEDDTDAVVDDSVVQTALSLAGAWSDLDWDEMVEALDRMRHNDPPSPSLSI